MGTRVRRRERRAPRVHERRLFTQEQRRLGSVEGPQEKRHDTAVLERRPLGGPGLFGH